MYMTHNLTTGEFRAFSEWSEVVRYLVDCEDQGYEVAYVKKDCVNVSSLSEGEN